jgi:hypothetical protein
LELKRRLSSIQEFPEEEAMKTPEVKPNKQRIISNLAPPSNLPSETRYYLNLKFEYKERSEVRFPS